MAAFIAQNGGLLRFGAFATLFAVMTLWELSAPRRRLRTSKPRRWSVNWGLAILNAAVIRLAFPAAAAGAALDARAQGWGLFNALDWPAWVEVALAMATLDFAIWAQHLVSHKIPALWRLHRVHHADRDIDVTTAIRFHPIEIALSMLLKIGLVYALGAAALAVLLFEIVLNGAAMFNHANIRMPRGLDRALRLVLVTPDMHRVHHSSIRCETDANYGFNLPWWDRLFGTYVDQPSLGHEGMTIGLDEYQDDRPAHLGWSLRMPFLRRES